MHTKDWYVTVFGIYKIYIIVVICKEAKTKFWKFVWTTLSALESVHPI